MNNEIEELLTQANKIISRTGNKSGTKYPPSLKKIITSLRIDHGMSVKEIVNVIPISTYSAREWPKATQNKIHFNKVLVSKKTDKEVQVKSQSQNYYDLKSIELSLKVLIVLIILLIFELIIIHLIL